MLLACVALPRAAMAAGGDERPNILVILTDDLGYGQLGYTGNPIIKTPNIDALSRRGIEFTQAYAGGPVCSPSRISMMTGKDARAVEISNNGVLLKPGDTTMAAVLGNAGYRTALFGKFGIGTTFGQNDPMTMGFQQWTGLIHNVSAHRQYPTYMFRNNSMVIVPGNLAGAKGGYIQRVFTDEALKYLDGYDGKAPFFMLVSYTSPHADLAAPDAFVKPYLGKFPEKPWLGRNGPADAPGYPAYYPDPVDAPNAVTAGMISALDAYVGEIVAKLDAKGLADNTIIVFTSDNGPHQEGGANPADTYASQPYRGYKRLLFDGGIHMPMLVVWPRGVRQPRKDDTPWAFADMLPTFAELAGVDAAKLSALGVNGMSIARRLNDTPAPMPDRFLYWEFTVEIGDPNGAKLGPLEQAARRGWLKAVRLEDGRTRLFDLRSDPAELNDISKRRPRDAAAFNALFDEQARKK